MRRVVVVRVSSGDDAQTLYGALDYLSKVQFESQVSFAISPPLLAEAFWGGRIIPPWGDVNRITTGAIPIEISGDASDEVDHPDAE
jgi:hypothetical protein